MVERVVDTCRALINLKKIRFEGKVSMMGKLLFAAAVMCAALQAPASAATFQGQLATGTFELVAPSPVQRDLGSSTLGSGVDFVANAFEFDFGVNTLTISNSDNENVAASTIIGFDFNGYRFVFPELAFPGLTSIDFKERTEGVTGTPSATLDGPNSFSIDLGGTRFENWLFPGNNLSAPASVTFEVTFAGHDAAVVPLPPSFAMALTVLGGFGLWARRKRAAA
jgi:hypothetical protein